ncbi:Uma2 family endonuclease [Sphingomonas sp. KR1UV-12]|uniref:Uma2 family endonuclease n=1 Tax=Sphingomonas aurea TaxID=3063994 RepID=A0ABT9EHB7_9SPHN|nr:Uma2 family endonuclease [Sphingomonas sp. KR1UV-12]MDP1026358.1 Uma2 family endonuclease [Sphingomonas sp. KR1UV-12]
MTVQQRLIPGKYRLTVKDFLRLGDSGVFGTDRTELLDGDIIVMNAEYRPHAWTVGELGYLIRRMLEKMGSDLHVMSASVALSHHDMPLPDIVLTDEPKGAGPIPSTSVSLVVEVASSTLDRDLGSKLSSYAQAAIPEYWVVDVESRTIHQFWSPGEGVYRQTNSVAFGADMAAATLPGLTIETAAL